MSFAIPMSLELPTMNRDNFADSFETLEDFLFYVKSEPSFKQVHNILSMYMGQDDNTIVIEEQPINGWEKFFETTKTVYEIDRSWRYIAMDWFDHVCSAIWDTH